METNKQYKPVDISKINVSSIEKRKSLVNVSDFAKQVSAGSSFQEFFGTFPDIFAGKQIKGLVDRISNAVKKDKPVVFAMGSHVIKVGLAPVINQLIDKKVISAIVFNGSALVHDSEIARFGKTSEAVAEGLADGSFGMAKETADFVNEAISESLDGSLTIGQALGRKIIESNAKWSEYSIFASAYKNGIPATVHIAVGTDIVHMHPSADGAKIGKASLRDFYTLADIVSDLGDGGVYVNIGSAVILPEVFMKALNIARNLGNKVDSFTTANLDFIQQYRARENVLSRPTLGKNSKSFALTGHHELMLPLLAQAIIEVI